MRAWLLLLVACGFSDADLDQDGVSVEDGDCDDLDPERRPGAIDVRYDGVDQDCDGRDLVDVDGDGFEAAEVGGTDCIDVDPQAHPNAWEDVGDPADLDCDGIADVFAGPWVSVSVGRGYACGLREDGGASCWGDRPRGMGPAPDLVFDSLHLGDAHGCGVGEDGVVCWGDDSLAQAEAPDDLVAVDAGVLRSCGIDAGGKGLCWGLGSGEVPGEPVAIRVADTPSLLAVWTCTLDRVGALRCWTQDGAGTLTVDDPGPWSLFDVDAGAACALDAEGRPTCWGLEAPDVDGLTSVAVGDGYACGTGVAGVRCWGEVDPPPPGPMVAVMAAGATVCGLREDGSLACWGEPLAE